MASFTDWLAATFYTSPADVQLHQDVAAAQQANENRLLQEGKVGYAGYYQDSAAIQAAGNYTANFKKQNTGLPALAMTVPWWVWALGIIGGWVWLGMPGLGHLAGLGKSAAGKLKSKL